MVFMLGLNPQEIKIFKSLNTPAKIQDFLDTIPINFEKKGETCMSPRMVLQNKKAHCAEGALFAAAVFMFHGSKPLLLDLKTIRPDFDHVVALFKQKGYWGAISKTNHPVLRYREPIYKTIRELALSYFHEYIWDDGRKTLRSYSQPFSLLRYDDSWVTADYDLFSIMDDLDHSKHYQIIPKFLKSKLRKADKIEMKAGFIREWK